MMKEYVDQHEHFVLNWVTEPEYGIDDEVAGSKMMKYEFALLHLDDSSIVVIVDCDVFVTNPHASPLDIWENFAHKDTSLILSRDAHWRMGVPVNSGMIIMKPGSFTRQVLETVVKKGRLDPDMHGNLYNAKTLVDQPRLTFELRELGQLDTNSKSPCEVHSHVTIVTQRVMNSFYRIPNSFWSGFHYDPPESKWRVGDFVSHVTGMDAKERVKAARIFGKGCVGIEDNTEGLGKLTTDGRYSASPGSSVT
ncbi:hypothetical protein TrRE_jg9982 [Triparma retinervis]|uniref:Nucleotide-diphospho-sugar transferase domain-containing protein n=1 Tax=Triparma retinervis TaxID=2557542 RepID=A0A9W7G9W1_9STRA|nr:hypothetical protein TrRE_jg9982 [Triparma retinervis]